MPASAEVATAKYWAAFAGQRVVHTAQHVHGGVGVDRDYPLHRYFLAPRNSSCSSAAPPASCSSSGRIIAAEPV